VNAIGECWQRASLDGNKVIDYGYTFHARCRKALIREEDITWFKNKQKGR